MKIVLLFRVLICAATVAHTAPVRGQDYPTRPIRLIVHTNAASIVDLSARVIAEAMSKLLAQPIVIENIGSAAGIVAFETVAMRSSADGHTLVTGGSTLTTAQAFVKDLRFDPLKDLQPISFIGDGVIALASGMDAPWTSLNDMVAYVKANPGKTNFGVTGIQSVSALAAMAIIQHFGVNIVLVPYPGSAQAGPALSRNEIQLLFYGEYQAVSESNARRIKVIAVSGNQRLTQFPGSPSFAEIGLPLFSGFWMGLLAPAATPAPIVSKLYGVVDRALKTTEVRGRLEKLNLNIIGAPPDASARRIAEEASFYSRIAKNAGILPK